jgi:hypothetical protein
MPEATVSETVTVDDLYWESGEGLRGTNFSVTHTGSDSFIFSVFDQRDGAYSRVLGPEAAQSLLDWLVRALA